MKEISELENKILQGNCTNVLKQIANESVNLVYLDPPFFTQKKHTLVDRESGKEHSFEDIYSSLEEYLNIVKTSLIECKRILRLDGSIFLHCDKTASHHLRLLLDMVFGLSNFRSEIVWSYKRWSNSKKGLLNSHQIIFFYSVSNNFKFNSLYTDYSATTNLDQILQERERDGLGKSVYKRSENGEIIQAKSKNGVPLSDVWEIPFLNPKAKERVNYPTQKPVLLLNQIIKIATDEGDLVVDPFCGSGTTCVSAKLLKRRFIGIDKSEDAVKLSEKRLLEMIVTDSQLLKKGEESYIEKTSTELNILSDIGAFPVHRNKAIDGFLKASMIPVRIQKKNETLEDSISKIEKYRIKGGHSSGIVVQTNQSSSSPLFLEDHNNIYIIKSLEIQLKEKVIDL